ncbi:MAG TPA: hypothetical protein VEF55_09065 [Candidatus Binatia bacterium]|nr:hypothetical protein [Candidatus Binatia bacterium]
MSKRTLPLLTLALGIATLIAFLWLGGQPAVRAVYASNEVAPAVSAFQRAETMQDIVLVFGYPVDEGRVAAMDALNQIDLWAFIPAYALFLSAAAIMLGGSRNRWTHIAIVFALMGAATDAIETWKQLQLTADISNAEDHLPISPWHWLKYAALALNGVAVTSLCLTLERKRWILGVLALVPFPLVTLAYMGAISPRMFSAAFAAYWTALLAIALIETVRATGLPARTQNPV